MLLERRSRRALVGGATPGPDLDIEGEVVADSSIWPSSAAFADQSIEVSVVNGKQQASFGVGDSRCVLVDDVIKCLPVVLASN
jgi:hypothetical protein